MIVNSAADALRLLIDENARYRRTSKGLARSLVWRDGVPPPEMGPNFGENLTEYLLLQADRSLIASLHLVASDNPERIKLGRHGFHRAAEAYESLLRNGNKQDPRRSLNRILAAASYHIAGYSASAFSLLRMALEDAPRDLMLETTSYLLERNITGLDSAVREATRSFYWGEPTLMEFKTTAERDSNAAEQNFAHSLALFVYSMRFNTQVDMTECLRRLEIGERFSLETGDVWSRLLYAVCRPLVQQLWENSIMNSIPQAPPLGVAVETWANKRTLFGLILGSRKIAELELWPSQVEAAARVFGGDESFAAALPTSAGKTRIAEMAIFKTLLVGKRTVYITPLRALSAQVERGFRTLFGPLGYSVSALYGAQGITPVDTATFDDNDIVVATPEKAGFALRNAPDLFDNVGLVVFDEAHLVSNESRGVAYEALIVALKRRDDRSARRMLALSALLPDVDPTSSAFSNWLSDGLYSKPLSSPIVHGEPWRPTRQCFGIINLVRGTGLARFRYQIDVGGEKSWVEDFVVQQERDPVYPKRKKIQFPADRDELALAAAEKLVAGEKSVLIYCPKVNSVDNVCSKFNKAVAAGFLRKFDISTDGEKHVERVIRIAEEMLPYGSEVIAALRSGLAVHHAQLPRAFLREIDRLISLKIVRVVVASPTVNAGLNIAATCVLFNGCDRGEMERFRLANGKFFFKNGEYVKSLKVLDGAESMNVAGRAGRAFVDTHGEVLGVCFDSKQEKRWNQTRERMAKRSFTSGLAVVLEKLMGLLEGKSSTRETVREIIANSTPMLWEQPPIATQETQYWEKIAQTLDQALLGLVDDLDTQVENLARLLDQSLNSSFFRAAIQDHQDEVSYLLLVQSRGQYLWQNSTAEQRKGWYFAGVGLNDGRLLDAKAAIVAPLIANIETSIAFSGAGSESIPLLTEIARHIFEIPTFRPKDDIPDGWERILKLWLEGASLQFIFAGREEVSPSDSNYREAARFIEDGIVYRLTWGMEAVRVRRPEMFVNNGVAAKRGLQCAAFLESGTLNMTVAVLLQMGLPSRRVAQEVVDHEGLSVRTISGLRAWLQIQRNEPEARWEYLDSAIRSIWLSFLEESGATTHGSWSIKKQQLSLGQRYRDVSKTSDTIRGMLCRISTKDTVIGEFQMTDGTPVGQADWPFGSDGPSFAEAILHPNDTIEASFVGPDQ